MSSLTAPGQFFTPPSAPLQIHRRHFPKPLPVHLRLPPRPPHNPIPNPTSKMRKSRILLTTTSAATRLLLQFGSGSESGSGSGFGGGGGDGGGGGGGGSWWRWVLGLIAYTDDQGEEGRDWDPHGLPADIVWQVSKLSAFKKYRISEISFFHRIRTTTMGTEDSFFEMVSLRPGGVYTKAQLQKELETLATCGMFEKVDMEGKTNPDGTISLTIFFLESTWQAANKFCCINMGLMQKSKTVDINNAMTEKEKMEAFKN